MLTNILDHDNNLSVKDVHKEEKSSDPQVSGLCNAPFLSYLPKRFTQIYRALYGDAMLVYNFSTPTWPPNHLKFTSTMKALSLCSRALVYAHKHIS